MNYAVKETDGAADEDLADHHVKIKKFFRHFRGLPKSVAAPVAQPEPLPEPLPKKKKGKFVAMDGKLNDGHVERFEIHWMGPLVFKFVREVNEMEWAISPSVLSQAVDAARQNKSDWTEVRVSGDVLALSSKQIKSALTYLLSLR